MEADLRAEFEQYGVIESIELLGKHEAYVTYVEDKDAYMAVSQRDQTQFQNAAVFFAQPADTWHQPSKVVAKSSSDANSDGSADESSPILQLDEDCLLEIFKRCDIETLANLSDVCKLFKNQLERHIFPQIRLMQLDYDSMALATARKILRCIGPHLNTLNLHGQFFRQNVERYSQKLAQYCENIRELNLTYIQVCYRPVFSYNPSLILEMMHFRSNVKKQISFFKPIFQHLEKLTFNVEGNCFVDLEILPQCLNLVKLKMYTDFCWSEPQPLYFPNLIYLALKDECKATDEGIFDALIAQNPQLKCVKTTSNCIRPTTFHYLPVLDKFSITIPNNDKLDGITYLSAFRHLTKLTLSEIDVFDLLHILEHVNQLTQLIQLKLYVGNNRSDKKRYTEYQSHLVATATDLICLEKFLVQGLTLLQSTIFDFVRFAKKLQSLHVHYCKWLPPNQTIRRNIGTQALVTEVVKARSLIGRQESEPLKLFVDREQNPDSIHSDYDERYLKISFDCKHRQKFVDYEEFDDYDYDYNETDFEYGDLYFDSPSDHSEDSQFV